jgi:mono/diheme cytochrome c family protein
LAPTLQFPNDMNPGAFIWIFALLLVEPAGPPVGTPAAPAPAAAKAPSPWDLLWTIEPPDGQPLHPRPRPTARTRTQGQVLYQGRCAACHGDKGDGGGPVAAKLAVRPTDFTRGVFKLRSTPPGSLPTDEDLFRTLTRGVHGTAMEPWRLLTEPERWALVGQIESFSLRFAQEPKRQPIAVPTPPRELKDLRDQGEILYIRYGCGRCHGDTGEGNGPAREAFRRDPTRQVQIRNFTRGRFIRGAEMEDLYLTLKVGIEGTPMAPYAALKDDELWALAAYVRLLVRERPLSDFPPAWQAQENGAPSEAARPNTL